MRGTAWRLLVITALVLAPLAGCLQGDSNDEPGAGTGDGDGTGSGDGGDAVTREEGYSTFQDAFANLGEGSANSPERMGATVTVQGHNASGDVDFEVDVLVDGAAGLFVISMTGEGYAGSAGAGGQNPFRGEQFITAQAWKTTFFGSEQSLVGTFNESAEPPRGLDDTSTGPQGGAGAEAFVGELQDVSQADVTRVNAVTYNARPAVELVIERDDGNTTFTGRVIAYRDPALPALVDARVQDPDAENEWERDATLKVEFRYGEDATHPLETPIKRLETMTLVNAENQRDPFFGGQSQEDSRNYTIQPSRFEDHRAPLEEVEAQAWTSENGDNGDVTPALVLPLEDGSVENEDLRLTFTDTDGDGFVTPGDELLVEYFTDDARDYQVGLFDEETGLRLMPAPGALVALALAAALAALAGRARPRA